MIRSPLAVASSASATRATASTPPAGATAATASGTGSWAITMAASLGPFGGATSP